MSLIARAIEEAGIPTLSMSSARDITRSAWPARATYLDFPLGHTAGRPQMPELNREIMRDTLSAFETLSVPGSMSHLSYRWDENDQWKDKVFAPTEKPVDSDQSKSGDNGYEDDRVARHDTPQYQTEADELAALKSHNDEECKICVGIDF